MPSSVCVCSCCYYYSSRPHSPKGQATLHPKRASPPNTYTHLEQGHTSSSNEGGVCLCVAAVEGDGRLGRILLQLIKRTCMAAAAAAADGKARMVMQTAANHKTAAPL